MGGGGPRGPVNELPPAKLRKKTHANEGLPVAAEETMEEYRGIEYLRNKLAARRVRVLTRYKYTR